MLEVHGLVKIYGSRKVVNGVSFEVYRGRSSASWAPTAPAKPRSFRMTCGMIEPNAGSVQLGGRDVTHWPMYRRAHEAGWDISPRSRASSANSASRTIFSAS